MASFIKDIIPDDIGRLIDDLEEDHSEQNLLTLLHKTDNSSYYFLSPNLQEIGENLKMPYGMTLELKGKKSKVKIHYDVEFERKDIDDGHYFLLKNDSPLPNESDPKVIPFLFRNDSPYAIVDGGLKHILLEYAQMRADISIDVYEHLGHYGILRGIAMGFFNKNLNKKNKLAKEASKDLSSRINELFRYEKSPSTLIHKHEYRDEDFDKKTMFVKMGFLEKVFKIPKIVYIVPMIALTPYSYLINEIKKTIQSPYENRFKLMKSKEEEERVLMSDFAFAHPKAINGFYRVIEFMKHGANGITFGLYVGATYLAEQYTHWGLSYPMMAVGAASGLTMLGNYITSGGRNSSGMISTLIDSKVSNRL